MSKLNHIGAPAIRKFIVWLGSFAIGTAPSAVIAKAVPLPLFLDRYATTINAVGAFREFLFIGVSVAGIAILNAIDHSFSGQYPFRKYQWSNLCAFALIITLLAFVFYLLLTMAQISPGQMLEANEVADIIGPVEIVIYAALVVEMIFTFNIARSTYDGSESPATPAQLGSGGQLPARARGGDLRSRDQQEDAGDQ